MRLMPRSLMESADRGLIILAHSKCQGVSRLTPSRSDPNGTYLTPNPLM